MPEGPEIKQAAGAIALQQTKRQLPICNSHPEKIGVSISVRLVKRPICVDVELRD